MSTTATSCPSSTPSPANGDSPLIWVRTGGGDNVVVITDDEMACGKVPDKRLVEACDQLEAGTPPYDVLGPKGTYVQFGAVHSISATLNRTDLVVEYEKGCKKTATCKFRLPDCDSQMEALDAAHTRMGPGVAVQKSVASRLFHMMLPFNAMMAILMTAGGFHYTATNMFDASETHDGAPEEVHMRRMYRPKMLRGAGAAKLGIVMVAAAAITAALLATLGYQMTLNIFFTAAGAAFFWTLVRIAKPPVTVSAVMGQR